MPSKLSPLEGAKDRALAIVDLEFGRRLETILGPLATVHSLKRWQAVAGGGGLIRDEAEREAVLARAGEQDAVLASIEAERLGLKVKIRAAASVADVIDVLSAVRRWSESDASPDTEVVLG